MSKTFAIIKPDAVAAGNSGDIIAMIEAAGFKVKALRKQQLTREIAEGFYAVHKGKGFFDELIAFMTEAPVVMMCLEKDNAVPAWRDLMGPTDPRKAPEGTIRKKFGTDIGRNATHGSDSDENAAIELSWFFRGYEIA